MASVSTDKKNGRKTVYFHNGEARKAIRLGLVTQKQAEEIARRIDSIISSQNSGLSLDPITATWLGQIDETLENKLIAVGVLQKRPAAEAPKTVSELVAYCLGQYEHGKSNTLRNIKRAADLIVERFGDDTLLEQIKKGDAADFRRQLSRDGFSDTTVTAHCKKARRLFNMAIDKEWIATNPFNGMKNWTDTNESRMFFVSREVTQRIIDACEPGWQLIVALVRYGGLRCPSEVLDLRWEWINLPESRMSIF